MSGAGTRGIYAVDATTLNAVTLFETEPSFCSNSVKGFDSTGNQIFFLAAAPGTTDKQLWRAPLDGSAAASSVSGRAPTGYQVEWFDISPNGLWIDYDIRQTSMSSGQQQLGVYIAPTNGSAPARQLPNPPTTPSRAVYIHRFTPDSSMLLVASEGSGTEVEGNLYAFDLVNPTTARRLTPQSCGSVFDCMGPITSDSRYTYLSIGGVSGVADGLYSVSLTGATPSWERVSANRMSGALVVNDTYLVGAYLSSYQSMPANGSRAPQLLVDPLPTGISGTTLGSASLLGSIACGGTCLILLGTSQHSSKPAQIYRAPLDGSAPAQLLFSVTPSGSDYRDWISEATLSPDGSRIVFRVDREQTNEVELLSLPVDGSAAAHRVAGWPALTPGYLTTNTWAMLGNGRHLLAIDPPVSTFYHPTANPEIKLLDTQLTDGSRQSVSSLDATTVAVSPKRYQVVAQTGQNAFFIVDALDLLLPERVYLPTLRR